MSEFPDTYPLVRIVTHRNKRIPPEAELTFHSKGLAFTRLPKGFG